MSNQELSHPQNYVTDEQTTGRQNQDGKFLVQFWGVRGLIPTPSSKNHRYGGNTACIEMNINGQRLVLDGGTGLRVLGKSWLQEQQSIEAHLFFTNSQTNRIQGFPFFAPAFVKDNCFHIYGTAATNGASIKQCLCDQMLQPLFPYPLQVMQSELQFYNLTSCKTIALNEITVTAALINKTQKSLGYRISWQDYNIAYITDLYTHADESECEHITKLTQDADLLIANATYNPKTIRTHQESDMYWQTATDLALNTGVKSLIISQHHPDDDDEYLDKVQGAVNSVFPKALVAYEGLVITVV